MSINLLYDSGTGNFSWGITLCHNINLLHPYLAPSSMNTTYNLEVFSPGVDFIVAGCYRLTFGAFCNHTDCWGKSSGSSFA